MTIIVSSGGKGAKRIDPTGFAQEDDVQRYITDNPDALPLYEIDEDIRLIVLGREVPSESGPIDAFGVDQHGHVYIIETKLYKNPDKRTVVAQVMDYGASLWRANTEFDTFMQILDKQTQKSFACTAREKMAKDFDLSDEAVLDLINQMQRNLAEGKFRFVVLMDTLEKRLRDLIVFINQNSAFDVFAVELKYYQHDKWEILIPHLYGGEVKKDVAKVGSGARKQWTEDSFRDSVSNKLDPNDAKYVFEMYDFAKINGKVLFGTGSARASAKAYLGKDEKYATFIIFDDGEFQANFSWFSDTTFGKKYGQKMIEIGLEIDPAKLTSGNWATPLEKWKDKASHIRKVILEVTR